MNSTLTDLRNTSSPSHQILPNLTLAGAEIESLRRRFLNEGTERSLQLLETLGSRFNPVEASRQVQEWAGNAEILGYPEISTLASAIHEMFAAHPFRIPDVRESLSSLILNSLNCAIGPPFPCQNTSRKRLAAGASR